MTINLSSLRACFGIRASNEAPAAAQANPHQSGFCQAVKRLCNKLFHSKLSPAVPQTDPPQAALPQALIPQGDPAANLRANQQAFNPKMVELLLNGLGGKLDPEAKARLAVAFAMTKTWGADQDPIIRFARASNPESLPEPAELLKKLMESEPGPQAFQRMLGLVQKKFYPMIERVLEKPEVAAQVATWLYKALGDGESLPKVRLLTQLDAPMLKQFEKLLDTLKTAGASPTSHHAQALALARKAQLVQTLMIPVSRVLYPTLPDNQKNDKDIAMVVVSNAPRMLENLSPAMRADKDVVMGAVKADGRVLAHVSDELKADRDVVHHAVSSHVEALQYASDELRADPEIVLQACKKYKGHPFTKNPFVHASDSLKNDRSFVLKLMGQSGACLKDAKPQFQEDLEVVKAAVSNNGLALKYASEILRANESIVKIAVCSDPPHMEHPLQYASVELRNNKDVVLRAVKSSSCALHYASDMLLQDKDVMTAAASTTSFDVLEALNPYIRYDDDVMTAAILHSATAFRSASDALRNDKELVMATVRQQIDAANYLPPRFLDDKEVMMAAVTVDGSNLRYASKRLRDDKDLVMTAVRTTRPTIEPGQANENLLLAALGVNLEDRPTPSNRIQPHKNVLQYASFRRRADEDVALAAVSAYAHQLESVIDLKGTLRSDHSIARMVFSAPETMADNTVDGSSKSRFDLLPDNFRNDKAFVKDAVSKDGRYLEHVDKKLQNDRDVVKAACLQNPVAIRHASDSLKNNPAFSSEIYIESLKYKNTAVI